MEGKCRLRHPQLTCGILAATLDRSAWFGAPWCVDELADERDREPCHAAQAITLVREDRSESLPLARNAMDRRTRAESRE